MSQSGMATGVSGLSRLADAQSRTISPENPAGAKGGAARAGETLELADIDGPGVIRQIWLTPAGCPWRLLVFRFYWDGQEQPSVECPLGRLLRGWLGRVLLERAHQVSSLPVWTPTDWR